MHAVGLRSGSRRLCRNSGRRCRSTS